MQDPRTAEICGIPRTVIWAWLWKSRSKWCWWGKPRPCPAELEAGALAIIRGQVTTPESTSRQGPGRPLVGHRQNPSACSNHDESESVPASHRRICHLTGLQNSAVMRSVGLSLQLHGGEGHNEISLTEALTLGDALGADVTAKVFSWRSMQARNPSFSMTSSRAAWKVTSPRTPYSRNQSQRTRQFPPGDRAWGQSGRGHHPANVLKGKTLSRWARHVTLRCLAAGRTSPNCHGHHPARHLERAQQIGADGNDLSGECYE